MTKTDQQIRASWLLPLAAKLDRLYAREYQDYLAACEADRREGHRPHYCEHGTDQWTDYDNICGPCEDGLTMGRPQQRMRMALDAAHARIERVEAINTAVRAMRAAGLAHMIEWAEVMDEVDRLLRVE